ncbi:MAG: hypothetical protein IJS08_01315 [Victivallales bacterium]|nr:hypothetical protein [Victivallales bacterium]
MAEEQARVAEFSRFGKSFQLLVRNGYDLEEAVKLDEALWGAISAPADLLIPDPRLRALLDASKTGRITSREVRAAIAWMLKQLPDHSKIVPEFDGKLSLAAINAEDEEGKALVSSAKYVLNELNAEDKETISLEQIRQFLETVTNRPLNGDGVLTPKAATASKEKVQQVTDLVNDVVISTGGAKDVDGSQGLDKATMDAFLAEVPKYLEWYDKGLIPAGKDCTDIMIFGTDTPAMSATVQLNSAKVDRFFQLCELLDFDSRINGHVVSTINRVDTFDPSAPEVVNTYQDALPIASPNSAGQLPLNPEKVSPAYRAWMTDFAKVVEKVLGSKPEFLTKAEWGKVKATFAQYEGWLASKAGASVEKVPIDRLRGYLNCAPLMEEVCTLMAADKKVSDIAAAARQVERLLMYRTDLLRIANNFVNFSELYDINGNAIFECGKMVIDGRWFEVSFKLDNPATHSALGAASQMFLMYVEVNMSPAPPMNVVIPVTSGSKGNLFVGKRGVFYDMNNVDHDAKVVKIIENPICLTEALLAPFSRLWGIIEGKLAAWSKDSESKLQKNFTEAITVDPNKPAPAPAKPEPEKKEGKMNGTAMMGIGVAAAALGSALAFISKTLSGMTGFQIWMMVIIALLALMLPISIIAIIKLSRQDISAILEGCGWGINLRLRLNGEVRRNFTHFGEYPAGAKGTPKSYALMWIIFIIIIVLLSVGGCKISKYCKEKKAEKPRTEQLEKEKAEKEKAEKEKAEKEKAEAATKADAAAGKADTAAGKADAAAGKASDK